MQRVSLQASLANISNLISLTADTPSNRIVVVQGKFAITKSWRGKYIASPTSLSIDLLRFLSLDSTDSLDVNCQY